MRLWNPRTIRISFRISCWIVDECPEDSHVYRSYTYIIYIHIVELDGQWTNRPIQSIFKLWSISRENVRKHQNLQANFFFFFIFLSAGIQTLKSITKHFYFKFFYPWLHSIFFVIFQFSFFFFFHLKTLLWFFCTCAFIFYPFTFFFFLFIYIFFLFIHLQFFSSI